MDGVFKRKLLGLRNPLPAKTFAEALFQDSTWIKKPEIRVKEASPPKEVFSEKVQVIESLERFAQEKSIELKTSILKVDGGELHLRAEPSWEGITTYGSQEDLIGSLKLDQSLVDIVLKDKVKGAVKALFVTEKFRPWEEVSGDLKEGLINELLAGFSQKTAELFERMIVAMKLDRSEVIIYPVEGSDETDYASEVMTLAGFFRPEILITLGAKATSRILKSNDRLSLVHVQFFSRKIGETSFQVVPLFHPSIIETNQNMKKTAWADMQKIMKHLKKLP